MKSLKIATIIILSLVIIPSVTLGVEVGDRFHLSGCNDNGELMVPIVNIWNKPGGAIAGAKVIGKLSGAGNADQGMQCQGAIVELLQLKIVDGGLYLKIKSTVNSTTGWVTDSFVGQKAK